jgi:hypothetical protein
MASASLLTRPSMGSIPLRAGKSSRSKCEHVTFNHGVEGSSPSALTNEIKYLARTSKNSVSQF